jgi:hypothetical protein
VADADVKQKNGKEDSRQEDLDRVRIVLLPLLLQRVDEARRELVTPDVNRRGRVGGATCGVARETLAARHA